MDALSYEEWTRAKENKLKRVTHGAEVVPLKTDSALYDIQAAILKLCFDDKHLATFHNLYFIPEALDTGGVGMYGYSCIMISKPYWKEHGVDDATISTMFHELVHSWDAVKGIKDTNGDFHNAAFKRSCEEHGGIALFSNPEDGYNDARPTAETMKRIKEAIRASNRARFA